MSRRILALVSLLLLLLGAVGACDGDGADEPRKADFDGAQVLQRAAQAMAGLKSTAFTVTTEDETPIMVKGGDLKLLRNGDAEGTLTIEQSGHAVEMKVVAVGDSIFLDAGTGGWREAPKALAATMYDPSAVLDPERGISSLLSSLREPEAEAVEEIGGKETYRVAATLPQDRIGGLIPGIDADLRGQVWVNKDDGRLVKVRGAFPEGRGAVVIEFTEFDAAYEISAPQ
ncbi:LppX_LprAFG lipoprotein [Actinomadura sp. WMMB 499]|uniref:LppX_LprAFG lipoprotein n=1 Tax=Actinomadura sp. WMMB 499 TaxID=1219491 RepID=UPI0012443DB2|nr:LppX_LprAFG lipoprotein [Actinomadura sp. WMMB 499]QFG25733.1 LppX_LprAFG lipoprotein [Actinomadura sp. WMMB 499]